MQDIAESENSVNQESNNVHDFLWGAGPIGAAIGRTERQAHHLLATGAIASAHKKGGRWVASRSALLREFGAVRA